MTAISPQTARTLVVVGTIGIWTPAALLLGYILLGLVSPPGIGEQDWWILGICLIVVAGLPLATRRAIRSGGPAAWALVVLGVGVYLLAAPGLVLVATAAETGAWPLILAAFLACGAALALGALTLIRSGPPGRLGPRPLAGTNERPPRG